MSKPSNKEKSPYYGALQLSLIHIFRMPFNFALVALFAAVYSGVTQFNMPIAFAMVPDALKRPELLSMGLGVLMIGANAGGALSTFLPAMVVENAGGVWAATDLMVIGFAVLALLCAVGATAYQRRCVLKEAKKED